MKKLISIALCTALGAAIGYFLQPDYWGLGIGGFAMFYIAGYMCDPEDNIDRESMKVIRGVMDIMTITYWMMGPAINSRDRFGGSQREEDEPIKYYSDAIMEKFGFDWATLPMHYRYNLGPLFQVSTNSLATPVAAIRRHNRKNKPGLFRKESVTYTMVHFAAVCLVDNGLDEKSSAWYFHCTRLLGVSDKMAYMIVCSCYESQMSSPTAVNYAYHQEGRKEDPTALELSAVGLKPTKRQKALMAGIGRMRAAYLEAYPTICT